MKVLETPLVEICEFLIDGTHGSPDRSDTGIPVLSAQNVKDGVLNFKTDRFAPSHEYDAVRRRYTLQKGDFLLTIVGTIGRAAIVEESREAIFQRSVAMMRLKPDFVLPRYMFHYSQSGEFQYQLSRRTNQAAQAGIYLKKLGEVPIPLPPLEEQKRIAAILDQADALRRLRARALERLNALGQAIFHEMFGDPFAEGKANQKVNLDELTTRITYGFTSPMGHHETGIPILTAKSVRDGFIDYTTCSYAIQHEYDALSSKSKPERGDILITKDGTIGRYAVFDADFPVAINQSVALVKPNKEKVVSEYLAAYFGSRSVQARFQTMKKGNALPHLQITELAKFPIFSPPLSEQVVLKDRLASAARSLASAHHSAGVTDTLFKSLQTRAFRGQL